VRNFQKRWTIEYFFTKIGNEAVCLICNEKISSIKEYNIKRHYNSKHMCNYDKYKGQLRMDKAEEMIEKLDKQQNLILSFSKSVEKYVKVSYLIAEKIAKHGKPFKDGEFIKECIQCVVDIISPSESQSISNISLSGDTMARRIEDLSENIFDIFKFRCKKFVFYSIAMDESPDINDIAQLAIFIRGVDEYYNITEELAALIPLKDTTKSTDLYTNLKDTLVKCGLNFVNISTLTTDGAPAMLEWCFNNVKTRIKHMW
jgi:Spin-doc zinc-finger